MAEIRNYPIAFNENFPNRISPTVEALILGDRR
jgi:hypothetical protein